MNQADFARLHDVSRKTVTQWKARGWLVMEGDDIDVEASNANLERYRKTVTQHGKNTQGNSSGNTLGNKPEGNSVGNNSEHNAESQAKIVERILTERGTSMTFDEARTMKENYLALLTQHDYDLKSGKVLPYQEMIDAVGLEYSRMRTRLVAIAPEHGPRLRMLATTATDTEFVTALQESIHEAMEELSLDNSKRGGG